MSKVNHKDLWEGLTADICTELVKLEKREPQTVEDYWVRATLWAILKKMCQAHRLPPKYQTERELTMELFED